MDAPHSSPSWVDALREPPSDLIWQHVAGHPHAPDDPFGLERLSLDPTGRLRLDWEQRGERASWTARVDPELVTRILTATADTGFPEIPLEPIPPGAGAFRTLRVWLGEQHADAMITHKREREEPFRFLARAADSLSAQVRGRAFAGDDPVAGAVREIRWEPPDERWAKLEEMLRKERPQASDFRSILHAFDQWPAGPDREAALRHAEKVLGERWPDLTRHAEYWAPDRVAWDLVRSLGFDEEGTAGFHGRHPGTLKLTVLHLPYSEKDLDDLVGSPLGDQLRHLALGGASELTSLEPLRELRSLEHLDVRGASLLLMIGDLSTLTVLRELTLIPGEHLSDLSGVASLPALERLHVHGSGFSSLAGLDNPSLQSLEIASLAFADLGAIGGAPGLRELRISPTEASLDLAPLAAQGGLPELAKLMLLGAPTYTSVEALRDLGALRELMIAARKRCDLPGLRGAPIEKLSLLNTEDLKDLSPLAELPSLAELDLRRLTALRDLSPLAKASTLRKLEIERCGEIDDLTPLAELRSLEELSLWSLPKPRELGALRELPSLRRLTISGCRGLRVQPKEWNMTRREAVEAYLASW